MYMKNLIKKILMEEFDLDWIQNQTPEPWEEFMFPYTELEGKLDNTVSVYSEKIVYRDKDGKWVFFHTQDLKNDYVWFNYDKIWSKFKSKFGFSYSEIQELLKRWLEQHYNLREVTPSEGTGTLSDKLEQHYNLREVTPFISNYSTMAPLEQHYNLREVTPSWQEEIS